MRIITLIECHLTQFETCLIVSTLHIVTQKDRVRYFIFFRSSKALFKLKSYSYSVD